MPMPDTHWGERLPPIFLAYPAEPQVVDSMTRLAEELRSVGARVTTWEDLHNPGFLFVPIADAIDQNELILAETTFGNANVLFELGYAIGKNKWVMQLEDANAARPRRMPPLAHIRGIRHERRQDILEELRRTTFDGPRLHAQLGLTGGHSHLGGLFLLPSRRGGDLNDALWRICQESPFDEHTLDMRDTQYDNLSDISRLIEEGELFVSLLMSENTLEYWDNNGQVMLFAGVAKGLNKDVAVLAQQPLKRLLDLSEAAISFESQTEAEFKFASWLNRVASRRISTPRPQAQVLAAPKSPLDRLFLGSLDARADFDLSDYFIQTPEFHQAEAGQRHLFVGSKGSGKTANFEILKARFEGRNATVVSVAPADFEFPRLAAILEEHTAAHWAFVFGSFWRYIILTEILRAIRLKFFDHLLRESGAGREYATQLVRWIDENHDALALDFVSRVSSVLSMVHQEYTNEQEERQSLETTLQTARMYEIERHLRRFGQDFEIRLLLDDLDRNWTPAYESANHLIVSLLNEVQALLVSLSPHIAISVFIRRDVFTWLESNDAEILKRDPGVLEWNADSLKRVVAQRIKTHTGVSTNTVDELWDSVFPAYCLGTRTADFILQKTMMRPRDIIQFCQKSVELAQRAGREQVTEPDIVAAWEPFGELMLSQIEAEQGFRYPHIGEIALAFLEQPASQRWQVVEDRLITISQAHGEIDWIREARRRPMSFLETLYQSGILGVVSSSGHAWYVAERPLPDVFSSLGEDFSVIVHPAFRSYLRTLNLTS